MHDNALPHDLLPGKRCEMVVETRPELAFRNKQCIVTGETIQHDEPIVRFTTPAGHHMIRIAGVDPFAAALNDLSKGDALTNLIGDIHHLPPESETDRETRGGDCVVCGKLLIGSLYPGSRAVHSVARTLDGKLHPFLHHSCREEFIDALDRVWEVSDDIAPIIV